MHTLIYSKLDPASGNATSAERLADGLRANGDVLIRAIPDAVPNDPEASAREVAALRLLADESDITLAIGIHCYRAGVILRQAFADSTNGGSAAQRPYLLIASGTDLNVDWSPTGIPSGQHGDSPYLQKRSPNATLTDAIAHAAGLVSLSPELFEKMEQRLAALAPDAVHPPHALIPQAPDIAKSSHYSLRATLGMTAQQSLILLPAGIRPVKGVALAIEAAAQALLDHPDHVLAILGPPLDPDYHALCASLIVEWRLRHRSLKGRLHLIDALPRADYLAVLSEAALLLNTSESEGMANAILEALGVGIAVLVRNIAGNRAIIQHNENGLIFEGLPAFLREYRRLFNDPALRKRLQDNGRETYRRQCDPAREKAAYLALIDRALGRP